MNKLTALIEAAKAANAFCNKCGYMGPDEPTHQGCDYMAKRTAVVPADTILELCALLEKAKKQLEWNREIILSVDSLLSEGGYSKESSTRHQLSLSNFDFLAAIKQWKEQT